MTVRKLLLMFGLFLVGVGSRLAAEEPNLLAQMEKVNQEIIAKADPSIACIIVSRDERYWDIKDPSNTRLLYNKPPPEQPGQLGDFNPALVLDEALRRKLDLSGPFLVPESFGSGVVVGEEGLILTNYHVVRDAVKVYVRLPGNRGSYANIHAADPRSDLAVLKLITRPQPPLKVLPIGDAMKLKRGQFLLSLANPYAAGFRDGQPSASWGILSNIRRRSAGTYRENDPGRPLHMYGFLLQTDVRLNLGCSGGALLNLQGELVGLTTSLAAINGIDTPGGFAIPFDAGLRHIVDVLKEGEEVEYGFLGVGFPPHTMNARPVETGPGLPINVVTPGSPAKDQAKLQFNDRILSINDVPVRDIDDLFLYLGLQTAGSRVHLQVQRNGRNAAETIDVTLAKVYIPGKRIWSNPGTRRKFVQGLRVDYTSVLVDPTSSMTEIPSGVLVSDVKPGSPAALAKLRPGDVISKVNGQSVSDPDSFYQVMPQTGRVELTVGTGSPQETPAIIVIP